MDAEKTAQIIILLIQIGCIAFFVGMIALCIYQFANKNKWKTAYKSAKAKYMSLYGNPDFEACDFKIWGPSYFFMLAYNTPRILVINGIEFKFADILNFRSKCKVSYQYHSSPVSGLIRGEIGRATIGGDKGFLLGAMTAPQYTTEHHKYIIRIITSHPQYKTLHYLTSSEDNGEMAINILEFVEKANEFDRKMSIIFPKR